MNTIPDDGVWMLAAAAPREADAVLEAFGCEAEPIKLWTPIRVHERVELVRTGVGKANAAGGVARVLDPDQHAGVISVGIGGVLPGSALGIGDAVCASRSVFSDEGVGTPSGFVSCSEIGFGYFEDGSMGINHDAEVVEWIASVCDAEATVACVSWGSGEDGCAKGVVARTGAEIEAMEGAACGLVGQRLGVRTGELRVVSNTTGNREGQRWDLDGAFDRLREVLGRLFVGGM